MQNIIALKQDNCKDCYKCIRNCPVKAIEFHNNAAYILEKECILCGRCYVVCPQNAKQVRSDAHRVREAIKAGKTVIASVAPSFVSGMSVDSIEDIEAALKALGFAGAEETAIGAGFVSRAYEEILRAGRQKIVISSCCPSINQLIQQYYPDLAHNLAQVLTPMQAHCVAIREKVPDAFTVFIGPCIAKKREADEADSVDACLTFDELDDWLGEQGVPLVASGPREEEGKRARLYPTAGGILRTMEKIPGYERMAIDGAENCIAALEEMRAGRIDNVFIEMSACEGSCIAGPIIREHSARRLSGAIRVNHYAGPARFPDAPPASIGAFYPPTPLVRPMPGGAAIQAVLTKMGKDTPEKELNCGCCGYPTCRDKAVAVCRGRAQIDMCFSFLKGKAESFSDKIIANTPNAIIVMDEALIVQEINGAGMRLFGLKDRLDIVNAPIVELLDPTDYLQVVHGGKAIVDKRHCIKEFGLYVEETVLYDERYHILISIMRDVTEQETVRAQEQELRRRTIEVTDKVIDKQMRVVQEIASLLGETTAETRIALTKLKEAVKGDD
ncbi:[Fe-Fe] hydrogenase large subunit C-terminal domain-containing protein [Bacillota bacterium Meth-B3]